MDQMKWIAGGSIAILALAALLFVYSDEKPSENTDDITTVPQVEITTEPADTVTTQQTPTSNIIQPTQKAMEEKTQAATMAVLHTTMGDITVKLYSADSPKTVENFVKLAKSGFYNGVKFHRVIKDFMIQSGDPLSKDDAQISRWGTGGPDYSFNDEFNNHKLVKGSLAMANSGPNTNGSQFFIVSAAATPWLDGKHTNFGEVTDGLDIVMKIQSTPTAAGDRPVTPISITSIDIK